MNSREKAALVVQSALKVEGRLSYWDLERIRAKLNMNPGTFYSIVLDLERQGVLKALKRTVNRGSHNKPVFRQQVIGCTLTLTNSRNSLPSVGRRE